MRSLRSRPAINRQVTIFGPLGGAGPAVKNLCRNLDFCTTKWYREASIIQKRPPAAVAVTRGGFQQRIALITQRGLRPQPKDVLTQRHQDTKKKDTEMPLALCAFVALCENQVFVFQELVLLSIRNLRKKTRFEQVVVRIKER